MKKMLAMVGMMIVGTLSFAGEVLKDGSGYQDVPWGSTIEQAKAKIPELKEMIHKPTGEKYLCLSKERMGATFSFKNNGLIEVRVFYEDASTVKQKILDKLAETYGAATRIYGREWGSGPVKEQIYLWEFEKGGIWAKYEETSPSVKSFDVYYFCKEKFAEKVKKDIDGSFKRLDSGGVGL